MHCGFLVGHDAIGHDRLGHLITNALARAGLLPAPDAVLPALTDAQLQVAELGPIKRQRFRGAVGGDSPPRPGDEAGEAASHARVALSPFRVGRRAQPER